MPCLGRSASAAPDRALGASRNGRKPRPIPLTAPLADAHENKIDALKCLEKRSAKLCFRCLRSCRKDPDAHGYSTTQKRDTNTIRYPSVRRRSVISAQISPKPPLAAVSQFASKKNAKAHVLRPLKQAQTAAKPRLPRVKRSNFCLDHGRATR